MSASITNTRLIIFDIDGTIIDDDKAVSTNLKADKKRPANIEATLPNA